MRPNLVNKELWHIILLSVSLIKQKVQIYTFWVEKAQCHLNHWHQNHRVSVPGLLSRFASSRLRPRLRASRSRPRLWKQSLKSQDISRPRLKSQEPQPRWQWNSRGLNQWSLDCYIHHVPKLATPLQISWCKIVNTWQIFTKCETFTETIILNYM